MHDTLTLDIKGNCFLLLKVNAKFNYLRTDHVNGNLIWLTLNGILAGPMVDALET
ncbi:MAG: hypothetical protein IPO32_10230 [Crocinitomicaceae bacterium]|nr:hypothetical protein [Crocinitomicaceae bacterium]